MRFHTLFFVLPSAIAAPWPQRSYPSSAAAYFLDNDAAGSSIVSMKINSDGTLSNPVKTSTNGLGSYQVNATGFQNMADTLGSQGSVYVTDKLLFTVNAGSDTLALFTINPAAPQELKLVGKPANTLGQFPISVDYSEELNLACVLNGGAVAGVACFSVDPVSGLKAAGPLRKLSKSVINESTPPVGPPGSAAQVLFNPDSTALFVTVKGNPGTTPVQPGSMVVWPVKGGQVSSSPVVTKISDIVLDFGFLFVSPSTIFLSDPSFGASLLTVDADWKVTETVHTVITGQKAICWTQYDPALNKLYAIDAGPNRLWVLDAESGALTGSFHVKYPGEKAVPGVFDSAIKNGIMYSLVGADGVLATDLAKQEVLQFLDLSSLGSRQGYMGMAVWPPE